MQFDRISEMIDDIACGKMVILMDDASRENEGDLILAARFATPENINFMARFGRGLICVPMPHERAGALKLESMTGKGSDNFGTAFTVSVDAKKNTTTGISAHDRAETIRVLADENRTREDLNAPGHVFPLVSWEGGVLARAGHTEAAVDIVSLAGIRPAVGVICEIMNDDGTMARQNDLLHFAKMHNIKISTIEELIEYRKKQIQPVQYVSGSRIPTQDSGIWEIQVFSSAADGKEHIALIKGNISKENTLARIHSECFTGDVLNSMKCDCRDQLHSSMDLIASEGSGIIIYLRQEGRGIGLGNKIKAYQLQENGYDTVEANKMLGFAPDLREYSIAAGILKHLGVCSVRLITNNPDKISGLEKNGIKVNENVSVPIRITRYNRQYLKTKKEKLGHVI